jgi:hypothetical protein
LKASYDYLDESGELLFVVERREDKAFVQRRPDGNGGWEWNLNGSRRVPYRLPRVIEAMESGKPVFVVEGEKDVHALEELGLTATCNPGGAGKWRDEWCVYFDSVPAYVLPDNDPAGLQHAQQVAESLLWVAEPVKLIQLPGLEDKQDVSDWLSAGGTRAELEHLAATTDVFTVADGAWQTSWGPDSSMGTEAAPQIMARSDGQYLLYLGKLHWCQGEPESGKTWFALAAVAEVLRSGRLVIFIDFEDSRTAVLERLHAMGVPTTKFVYVHPTEALDDNAVADVERLMALEPSLVVIDGIAEAMAINGLDPIRNVDVATFVHEVLNRFRGPGLTTVVIDHVARGDAGRGRYAYGSQHKLATVDGAAYRFETIQPFSRVQGGAARIDVAKDRPGYVRSFALSKDRAGVLRVVPGDRLEVTVEPPMVAEDDGDGELSYTQRRVLEVLPDEGEGAGLTYTQIGDRLASDGKGLPLKKATIKAAINALIDEKGLIDGVRTDGREPSTFWQKGTDKK